MKKLQGKAGYVLAGSAGIIAIALILIIFNRLNKPSKPDHFGIGRPASLAKIKAMDIDVRPDGKGLPIGAGNVQSGLLIYNAKCIACHGNGEKTESPLPGEPLFLNHPSAKTKTIGTYWPYATTIFDYVRRAMPYNAPGSLSNQEVYHLTAYLLYANKIIPSHTIITNKSLPQIVMPAQKKYVDDDREGGTTLR